MAAGLAADGAYRSQWITGISAGSRSAMRGGERHRFEHAFFAGAYDDIAPASGEHPESTWQQLKYLWHTVLARGRGAEPL